MLCISTAVSCSELRNLSPKTIRYYEEDLQYFARNIPAKNADDINRKVMDLDCLSLFRLSRQHFHHLSSVYQKRPLRATFFSQAEEGSSKLEEASLFYNSVVI